MFNADQIANLDATIDKPKASGMKQRTVGFGQNARDVWYMPGDECKRRLNAIFGHGNWDREVIDFRFVWEGQIEHTKRNTGETYMNHGVQAMARVRLTVRGPDGGVTVHEDVGFCDAESSARGMPPHDMAGKGAVTDGLKRAAVALGNALGLSLYDDDPSGVEAAERMAALSGEAPRELEWEKASLLTFAKMKRGAQAGDMKPGAWLALVIQEELGQPNIENMAQLDRIKAVIDSGDYDAATGERIPDGVGETR